MLALTRIKKELTYVKDLFLNVIEIIPQFDIASPDILPYGLKPHTRSVSWIVEQVIVQQAKFNRKQLNIKDVDFNLPDTSLHDCVVVDKAGKNFYINIKITSNAKRHKNDISAVEKLYMQYTANPKYRLIFAVFQFTFQNTTISLSKDKVHTFSPQFLPVYVNPRNDKIQSDYYAESIERSRSEFLNLLKQQSTSIVLR